MDGVTRIQVASGTRQSMASAELQQLIAGMRASGLDFTRAPGVVRSEFAALLAAMPAPEGVEFRQITLGDLQALECRSHVTDGEGALLYFHGGGYIAGSAEGYRGLPAMLGEAMQLPAYSVDYRLAPEARFPAAVEDAAAAYRALVESGIPPARIVLAGDSAGGGLALAALVSLRDQGVVLPAAALLLSPWVDLACQGESFITKANEDPSLTPTGLQAAAGHYLGTADPRSPLASPLYASLAGLPPLLIQVGSAEILLDDAVRLAGRAGAAGTAVQLQIWPGMIHVWQSFAFMLPEGREAISAAALFVRNLLSRMG